MSSRAKLFSREHALEFAIVCLLATALLPWLVPRNSRLGIALIAAVVIEIVFIGKTTRHAWRQFATFEQTEWNVALGRTSRALLALDYIATTSWRAAYHTAVWFTALAVAHGRLDLLALPAMFAWMFVPRVVFASWRHLGGSRAIPRIVRYPLSAPRSTWWRLPAQVGVVAALLAGSIGVVALLSVAPWIWWLLAPLFGVVLYVLVRTSEPFDTDTEVTLSLPRLNTHRARLSATTPNAFAGLLWFGTKSWWRWVYVPLVALVGCAIARDSWVIRRDATSLYLNVIVALLAASLVAVLAASQRSLPLRMALLTVCGALLLFVIPDGMPDSLSGLTYSRWDFVPDPSCVAAFVLALASVLAAAASPYQWESRGAAADSLRVAGIENSRLRRIELLTGFGLGAIGWTALAATYSLRASLLLGSLCAALCLLLQDRTRYAFGRVVVEPRRQLHGAVALILLLALVVAPSACSARELTSAVTVSAVLAILSFALGVWLIAWRRAGISVVS